MKVIDAIKSRFSVRNYLPDPVSDNDLDTILEAARFSQSAKNLQDWRFIVVKDENTRQKLSIAAKGQLFVAQAPVVIVCCGINIDYTMTCGQHSYNLDVAIAMENMSLVAHELGLGTCWLGAFYEEQVKKELNIPEEDVRVVGLLTIGCPAVEASPKSRNLPEEIIRYEKWS